jgi:hypothetical protein
VGYIKQFFPNGGLGIKKKFGRYEKGDSNDKT